MTPTEAIQKDIERLSKTVNDLKVAGDASGIDQAILSAALANYLSQFYTGVESCLEKKFKLAKMDLPEKSSQYHKDILTMALASKLLPSEESGFLFDLMFFRHFARHGYGSEYRFEEIMKKAAKVQELWPELKGQLGNALPQPPLQGRAKDAVALNQPKVKREPKTPEEPKLFQQLADHGAIDPGKAQDGQPSPKTEAENKPKTDGGRAD